MQKRFLRTRKMVLLALMIALKIVIVRYLSFRPMSIRISFGFVPASLCSMLFGPWIGALIAFLADGLGTILTGQPYFPGFGLSELLYGLSYGLFLYKRQKKMSTIFLCILLQTVFIDLCLGTYWIYFYYHAPFMATLIKRLTTALVMFPIELFGIKYTWELIGKRLVSSQTDLF